MKPNFWNKGKIYLSKNDKILKSIINNYPKQNMSINKNYFDCIVNSIIGQQISVAAANSIKNRFFKLNKTINPSYVLKTKKNKFKTIGLSEQKINYIKNVSYFFKKNQQFIKNIESFSDNEIKEELIKIKGVGPWTADMFLIFSLGRSNIFPTGDLGLINAISISYKYRKPISEKKLNELFRKWSPYCSIATWYLWRSLDPIPINY